MIFEDDGIIQVTHQISCGEVGRACQYEGEICVFRIGDDELVVHATSFVVIARMRDDGTVEAIESDIRVLALIDPSDLNSIGSGCVERDLKGLIIEVVGSYIQCVLGTGNPCRYGIVHVGAE